ncbi:Retrovirus-related Pol polyprotein from transposon 297 [Araneus ventricosus]|uniref:RNA-directed DNA polymerase n=1 Tax=Araneus ventricosus TaxID=182803 RepID=A0A4Y1ZKC2_ARAVE|nr:Retrovirus-related Pol polyprotein from transposon 297 [Araneus ventricosus]
MCIWSTLDLQSGYWQIKIAPEHRSKTAFITPGRRYQSRVMPFGLRNAPSTFQRMVNHVLKPVLGDCCECYLDDIVIYSNTPEEHYQDVEKVLTLLHKAKLTLKPEKCHFFQRQLEFLGYLVSEDGMRPQENKIRTVQDFPIPHRGKKIRQFLGLCSWHKAFIPQFSNITAPFYHLTKKQRWKWDLEEQRAFDQLKTCLTHVPVLA